MYIQIFKDNERLDFENILFKDFKEDVNKFVDVLRLTTIDFSSINNLKGEKTLLEKAFRDEKTESLNR